MADIEKHSDNLSYVGIMLLAIPFIAFFGIYLKQCEKIDSATETIRILSIRSAAYLPFCQLLIWLSLMIPYLASAFEIGITVFEGYAFYCFVALVK